MSQFPPPPPPPGMYGSPYGVPMPQNVSNPMAITSLITGLLGCLIITPFIAIITGIIGVVKARPPVGGKGMAISGIILGFLWIIGLGIAGATMWWGYDKFYKPVEQANTSFLNHLVKGDVASAAAMTDGVFSKEDLGKLTAQVKPFGAVKGIAISGFDVKPNATGGLRITLSGVATFDSASKDFDATLSADSSGASIKIQDFKIR